MALLVWGVGEKNRQWGSGAHGHWDMKRGHSSFCRTRVDGSGATQQGDPFADTLEHKQVVASLIFWCDVFSRFGRVPST